MGLAGTGKILTGALWAICAALAGCTEPQDGQEVGARRLSNEQKAALQYQAAVAVRNFPEASGCSQIFDEIRNPRISGESLGESSGEISISFMVVPRQNFTGAAADQVTRRCFGQSRSGWVANIENNIALEFEVTYADGRWRLGNRIDRSATPAR